MISSDLFNQLKRLLAPLERRVMSIVGRAVIRQLVDGEGLKLGLLSGEETAGVPLMQEYGLASHPPAGAQALVLFPNGDRSHGFCIATEDPRFRPAEIPEGAVMLYTQQNGEDGHYLLLGDGRVVELAGETVTLIVNGTPLAITGAEGVISIIAPGIIQINDTVIPASGGGGSGRPAVANLSADTVNIEADQLTITLGGTTYIYGAATGPARIGTDQAGGDTITKGD